MHVPLRGARVIAGRDANGLFHKKVKVEGAEENLTFNITIPLPTQGMIAKHASIILLCVF